MFSFKKFITEAKVSQRNLDKVASIFKRILERELGFTFYRFDGENGFVEIKGGAGILFIAQNGKAVRLNYRKGEIESLTVWNKYTTAKPGEFTIDLMGIGLMDAGKTLIDTIRNPKPGKAIVYESLEHKRTEFIAEAKRIRPTEALKIVEDELGTIANVSVDDVKAILAAKDFLFPTVFWKHAVRKGVLDLSGLKETGDEIQVKSGDNLSDGTLGKNAEMRASKAEAKVRAEVERKTASEQERKDPNTLFGHMIDLTKLVTLGIQKALVIYGGPGIGKTYEVTKTIGEMGLEKNRDWYLVKGRITTASLYQTLFMHRKGALLVFDDTDSVWGDKDAANVLKAALDSYDTRTISWLSGRTINVGLMSEEEREDFNDSVMQRLIDDPGDPKIKLPSEFNYEGRIIFISNLARKQFDSAVLNRSAKIDMTLTKEQMFQRMESILPYLGDPSVDMKQKNEVLEFLREKSGSGTELPSMRTYVAAEGLIKSGMPNWKDLLQYV